MFSLFNKKTENTTVKLKIDGMHCTSCSMNIDLTVEEIAGVKKSETSYATSTTVVTFDSEIKNLEAVEQAIKELGYTSVRVEK